jgi:hypothetical protein
MGFFSWECAECGGSISNKFSTRPDDSDCVLITPDKNYHDPAYEGYGKFNGVDVYELLGGGDRDRGVEAFFNGDVLPFDIKVIHKRCQGTKGYDDYEESDRCPDQGYFYDDYEA